MLRVLVAASCDPSTGPLTTARVELLSRYCLWWHFLRISSLQLAVKHGARVFVRFHKLSRLSIDCGGDRHSQRQLRDEEGHHHLAGFADTLLETRVITLVHKLSIFDQERVGGHLWVKMSSNHRVG